tara:strand:+ start:526 stop:720 length:195 start_codon:yes stop_codon:yes gene_type:complete
MRLKFKTVSRDAEWDDRYKFIDPQINSSKNYNIIQYVDDYVIIEVDEDDVAAFRKYVGYIEDVQ